MTWRALLKLLLAVTVSAACLGWLLSGVDRELLVNALAAVAPGPVVVAFALALSMPFWRGARLARLVPSTPERPRGALTRVTAEVLFWSFLLPFKLGELTFLWFLNRRLGIPAGDALAAFVLVRVADLAAIIGLGAVALAATGLLESGDVQRLALVAGVAVIVSPLAIVAVAERMRPRSGIVGGLIAGAGRANTWSAKAWLMGTTLGLWTTHALILWLVLDAAGLVAAPAAAVLASAAGNLAFALPVPNVLGLGPQQVAVASVVERVGASREAAIGVAITTYVVVVSAAVFCGVIARWARAGETRSREA